MTADTASARVASPGRRLIVEVRWGASAGSKGVLEPGRVLQVGRAETAGLSVPGDASMSELHFELAWDGTHCTLRDLKSGTGTLLDGQRVEESQVSHGGWVRAGMTDFSVHVEAMTPPNRPAVAELPVRKALEARALKALVSQSGLLFAVMDAAQDARVLVLLRESVEEYRSLYDGPQGDVLAEVAPLLVSLPRDSRLLESLVQEGWGMNWGLFLTSQRPFKDVRRHLRKFLMIQDSTGQELYFRFYDPRVLPIFLPRCSPEQLQEFFGGIDSFLMEGSAGERLLRFSVRERKIRRDEVSLVSA
ncbi:DUF4123 domain-containing protein [Archangium violaceum]|uniref:DUF4123 domain-containing protein n=1 Tax=Archangium violaceum TaxID=83451 RepID=UPI00193C6C29|nr:DUF4123 domain-containing protein [Archangium violaceum]QRK09607.1 DUF4123 domain-containing protein [Archangium violaceum]